jgi:signal transduction histidine kinase/ActR/RegA family two-component response regulator
MSSAAHRLDPSVVEELQAELARERKAHQLASEEARLQRRHANSFEGIANAVGSSRNIEQLLERVLKVFVDDMRASVAVIRLRDGRDLRSRASIGLESEVNGGFSLRVDEAFDGQVPTAPSLEVVDSSDGNAMRSPVPAPDLQTVLRLALVSGDDLVGAIWLGLPHRHELNADDRRVLGALGTHATTAVLEQAGRESLERAVRSRDEILGIVAHDLRNPLNVISAAANSLHHRLSDSVSRRPLERIMRAAQRAEHLIRDLLDLSAIEGGHFSIDKRPIDTTSTVLTALDSQQGLAAASCVILASDLSPALPWIDADEERILEVLENLVGNAIKFTMAGGTVTVGAALREESMVLWVKDNGPGIAADQLTHLFDRFWQASKTDRRGTGLGLTICKAIVEAHGGRIWAESEPGVGTTVFFTVPAHERAPKSSGSQVANILMVDDRPENLLSLRAILEQPDYRLVSAGSGEEALSLTLRETFAVALIDISMPGMDGLEVAIHMKELERSRDIPIIFITAFGDDPEEIHRAYSAGGADYLVKPLDAEIVRKKVAVFVDLSRRRDDRQRQKSAEAKR